MDTAGTAPLTCSDPPATESSWSTHSLFSLCTSSHPTGSPYLLEGGVGKGICPNFSSPMLTCPQEPISLSIPICLNSEPLHMLFPQGQVGRGRRAVREEERGTLLQEIPPQSVTQTFQHQGTGALFGTEFQTGLCCAHISSLSSIQEASSCHLSALLQLQVAVSG